MNVLIKRIGNELVFIETEDKLVFGIPAELFDEPKIGDMYVIKRIITTKDEFSIFDLSELDNKAYEK